jgi:hypothetical protein
MYKVIMIDVNVWVEASSKDEARDKAVEDCLARLGYVSPVINVLYVG